MELSAARTAWVCGLGAVLVGPVLLRLVTAPAAPLWTQLSTATGLLALSALACAAILPSRVRSLTRAFGIEGVLDIHRSLGIVAAALVLLHIACVVAADPTNVALLSNPAATSASEPAVVATVAIALVVVLAITRSRVRQPYELWRWGHVVLAAVVLVGSAMHVWQLQQLVKDSVMSAVLALVAVLVLAVLTHRWVLRTLFDPSTAFVVRDVRRENDSVSTLVLDRRRSRHGTDGQDWTFAPGQFAWLRLDRSIAAEEHPFTIASSAHDLDAVEFTVRHTGNFTAALRRLQPGRPVWIDGPHGAFTVDESTSTTGVVMVAGGVGVTPMMSMLRTAAHRRDPRRFRLVLVVARTEDVLFRAELGALTRQIRLDVVEVLRGGATDDGAAGLTTALAGTPQPERYDYFVCGSTTLVGNALNTLDVLGVPADRVHTELFDLV